MAAQVAPNSLQLLNGNKEANQWAAQEAALLQNMLSGGADKWGDLESKLLNAQESMFKQLETHPSRPSNNDADLDKWRAQFDDNETDETDGGTTTADDESDSESHSWQGPEPDYGPEPDVRRDISRDTSRATSRVTSAAPSGANTPASILSPRTPLPAMNSVTPRAILATSKTPVARDRDRDGRSVSFSDNNNKNSARTRTNNNSERTQAIQSTAHVQTQQQQQQQQQVSSTARGNNSARTISKVSEDDEILIKTRADVESETQGLRDTVNRLQEQLKEEEERSKALQEVAQSSKIEEARSQGQIMALQKSLQDQEQRLNRSEQEIKQLQDTLRDRETTLVRKNEEYQMLQRKLSENDRTFEERVAALIQQKAILQEQVNRYVQEVDQVKSQLAQKLLEQRQVEEQIRTLEREKLSLQVEVQKNKERSDTLKIQLQDKTKEANDARTENMIKAERINTLEREKEALTFANDSRSRASEKNNASLEVKINTLVEQLSQAQSHEAEVKFSVERKKLQDSLDEQIQRLRDVELTKDKEIRTLKQQLNEANEISERLTHFKKSVEQTFEEKRSLEQRIKQLESDKRSVETEVYRHKDAARSAQFQLEQLQEMNTTLKHDVNELRAAKSLTEQRLEMAEREKSVAQDRAKRADEEKQRAITEKEQLMESIRTLSLHTTTATASTSPYNHTLPIMTGMPSPSHHAYAYEPKEGIPSYYKPIPETYPLLRERDQEGFCCTTRSDGTRSCNPKCTIM